jgi:hypothetical protein
MGEKKGAYRILVGRPEGRRPLGRPMCRLEDNIKMDLQAYTGFWWGDLKEDDHLGDPCVDWRIILKWIFK